MLLVVKISSSDIMPFDNYSLTCFVPNVIISLSLECISRKICLIQSLSRQFWEHYCRTRRPFLLTKRSLYWKLHQRIVSMFPMHPTSSLVKWSNSACLKNGWTISGCVSKSLWIFEIDSWLSRQKPEDCEHLILTFDIVSSRYATMMWNTTNRDPTF